MFGAIPKTAWSRRYPSDGENGCVLAMRCLLILTDEGKIVLTDTGAGSKQMERLTYYRFFNLADLSSELRRYGVEPEEVTDVVLTHLHFDHCGNATQTAPGNGQPVVGFPNATYWVSHRQWENFRHPNPLERDSYFPETMEAVQHRGVLRLITEETALCPTITLRLFDGHTPGQIAPYIRTAEQTYVFAGDVIPLAASVSPEWISAYDTYPVTSHAEKCRMLEEAVREKQVIIYCHDAYTVATTVKKVGGYYTKDQVIPLDS